MENMTAEELADLSDYYAAEAVRLADLATKLANRAMVFSFVAVFFLVLSLIMQLIF